MVTANYGGKIYEIYEGTNGDDPPYILNNPNPLIAHGYNGADNITGGNADDLIFGDDGDDRLQGGGSRDTLDGGWGDDKLFGEADNDLLQGWQGKDELFGGAGNDILVGGSGTDILNAHDPNGIGLDTLLGGADSDTFILGETGKVFYLDPANAQGQVNYAVIGSELDVFQPGIDKIQLAGAAGNYTFALEAAFGSATTDIKITENNHPGDVIAFIVDVPLANLNIANDVIFV
ncbi:MAG: calcium-binding protein [Xenococcaceae cyanobacterium]